MGMAMELSALDRAMGAGDGEEWAFWRAFAEAELFLMLAEEARDRDLRPQVYAVSEGSMVLVFDREDRLARFAPVPVPYAALPGRVVAQLAAEKGLAVGLNLGSGAVSETVLPAEALVWLVERLAEASAVGVEDRAEAVAAPQLGAVGLAAVEAAMRGAAGLAGEALLAQVRFAGGRQGTLLAFPGVGPGDQPAVARAVAEALALSGLDAAALDVAFPDPGSALADSLRRVGRRYVPQVPATEPEPPPPGPGMDKSRVPRLK